MPPLRNTRSKGAANANANADDMPTSPAAKAKARPRPRVAPKGKAKDPNAETEVEAAALDGPVYFWKPELENGYLGQWFVSPFTVEGEVFRTAEMWMMVGKARLFGDEVMAKKMLATTNPKTHKALGRKVKGFDEGVWDDNKLDLVTRGNYLKFTAATNAHVLREWLLATGNRELVEASPRDTIWGIGFTAQSAAHNRHRWGENLLGISLMDVRERLRKEAGDKVQEGVEGVEGEEKSNENQK